MATRRGLPTKDESFLANNVAIRYNQGVSLENLAPWAKVSGPGNEPRAAVDGVKQQDGTGEWIGGSANLWFGWIHYPTNFELKWETPQQINKVVIYDRPSLEEHMG